MRMKKRWKSRRMCDTLPNSQALSPQILCISHMQSQCTPQHRKAATVFPSKSWKITFCSKVCVFFLGLYHVFMIFFSCSHVILPLCDQRNPSVFFLINFSFHVRMVFDIFVLMLWSRNNTKERKQDYYSHHVTHKLPEGKEHFTCEILVLLSE